MKREYDIFISYRRDGGESTAKILRDKLEDDPKNPRYIITVRGLGYKLEK